MGRYQDGKEYVVYAWARLSVCIKDIHRQNITYPHVDHVACTRSIFIISA